MIKRLLFYPKITIFISSFFFYIPIKSQVVTSSCTSPRFLDNTRCDSLCVLNEYLGTVGAKKTQKIKSEKETGISDNGKPYSTFIKYDTNGVVSYFKETWNKKTKHEYALLTYDPLKKLAKYHFIVFYKKRKNVPDTINVILTEASLKSVLLERPRLNIIADKWNKTMSQHKGGDTIKFNESFLISEKVVGAGFDRYDHYVLNDKVGSTSITTYIRKGKNITDWFDFFTIKFDSLTNRREITDFNPHYTDEGVFEGYLVGSKELEYKLDDGCLVKEFQTFWKDDKHSDKPVTISKYIYGPGLEEDYHIDGIDKTYSHSKFETTYYK